jgi:hypothetical protein
MIPEVIQPYVPDLHFSGKKIAPEIHIRVTTRPDIITNPSQSSHLFGLSWPTRFFGRSRSNAFSALIETARYSFTGKGDISRRGIVLIALFFARNAIPGDSRSKPHRGAHYPGASEM